MAAALRPRAGDGAGPSRARSAVAALVLAVALLLSALSTAAVWSSARERDTVRFQNAVQSATDRIEARMELYSALLQSGAGLFAADDVSAEEWRRFVERLEIDRRFPGIQGFGFTRRMEPARRDALIAARRAEGRPAFHVWPDAAREEYHSILYLEPLDARNEAALGYDMFTEPVRREAMARARDTGAPALSGRVTLVQEIEGPTQAGFLLYVPVYERGARPASVDARRSGLDGFVYAPFRADDLFSGIFGTETEPRVAFRVYDGPRPDSAALLHDSRAQGIAPADRAARSAQVRLEVEGRSWTIVFEPTDAFRTGSRQPLVPAVAVVGLLVSLVLFGLSRAQDRARRQAVRNAVESNALSLQLQEQTARLELRMAEVQALNQRLEAADAAREAALRAAEEANRAKGQFLANMSHELRTPLNAIGGYAELLLLGIRGPISEAQRRDLERVQHAQQHLLGLINTILNFARIEAGRLEFRIDAVSVRHAVERAEEMVAPLAARKGIDYRCVCAEDDVAVHADPDRLQQVLLNLLSNAVKFTQEGGRVRTGWHIAPRHVDIFVRDTGCGIPAGKLHTIFDPFVQVDADLTRTSHGTGLGLAISRELARAMGGELRVESEEGAGSTFLVRLPRADVADSDEPARRDAPGRGPAPP